MVSVLIGKKRETLTHEIGTGGQASVFAHPRYKRLAVKVFPDCSAIESGRLQHLINNPPNPLVERGSPTFAWPLELARCPNTGDPIGYLMPRVFESVPLMQIWNPTTRIPQISARWLTQVAESFLYRNYWLHWSGYVRGDISGTNDLVNRGGQITSIDVDSTQFQDQNGTHFGANWGLPDFQPPELIGCSGHGVKRSEQSDVWSIAVVIHMLLRDGEHPFNCHSAAQGARPTRVERIKNGFWPDGGRHPEFLPPRGVKSFRLLPACLQTLFRETFDKGHKDPGARPSVLQYLQCIQEIQKSNHW